MDFAGNLFKTFGRGLGNVLFPRVCICCGMEVTEQQKQICTFCLMERFQDANPGNSMQSAVEFLPEGVLGQHALWQFDKGGKLQDLIHQLKYDRLTQVGIQLGARLGSRIQKHPQLLSLIEEYRENCVMVPVPLHYWKFMRRGFNQAFKVAQGVEQRLDIPICGIKDVIRQKNTRSQTGFDLEERNENMKDAFKVKKQDQFREKLVIIVDDVFTTGATTFELSGELLEAGAAGVIILTVAQA
ncbi:ComF family protein [Aliifodinibius sp. S!AR15-10]|uniref:ComF family protein n=1 Tax=Aliifodinibius sp. S!AR15-10 TaxID=2950437 RepID=UPI00285C703B|nr:ComF family protein [Aliifodinibius sp. S!AR15-10]MDR8391765.1 ComF family protein [Aliifodinibius sp. S!AR15-10]